ncbi:hypothetical protein LP420_12370 [Massilia sp. B-10]|nr:hypothetical protein LP420_12370 [Massilia sp. B-10]
MQRPFHIVNTTLNMVSGTELAWQTRRCRLCVHARLLRLRAAGHAHAWPDARRRAKRRAAATAARPSTTPAAPPRATTTAASNSAWRWPCPARPSARTWVITRRPRWPSLLTLFNVRLGRWFANPLWVNWKKRSPRFGLVHLLAEMFGMSDSGAHYLSLSDGGHFENLGIYELVRRRCRLIVVVDAGADGNLHFEDLGNAIRKCATDLNIQIDIDVSKVDLIKAKRLQQRPLRDRQDPLHPDRQTARRWRTERQGGGRHPALHQAFAAGHRA